ncbi:MAG: calcium-binding protein [Desulfovibrio sp.]|nr:calcium-binding protein [Desulfovibrio sp.]
MANTANNYFVLRGLNSEWIHQSLNLINDSFGLNFNEEGTSVRTINVIFVNKNDNVLAAVSHYSTKSSERPYYVTESMTLKVNEYYYGSLDTDDVNGAGSETNFYLDRTIAHEMTHAVMSANINNFNRLPDYIVEGAAELVHGIDDERQYILKGLTAANFERNLHSNSVAMYAAGYVWFRYLANNSGRNAQQSIKDFMASLDNYLPETSDEELETAKMLDNAVSDATGGKFGSAQAVTDALVKDFKAHGSSFLLNDCSINLDNDDTGAILGLDAGGTKKTAESVVPEDTTVESWGAITEASSTIDGLTIYWPEKYVGMEVPVDLSKIPATLSGQGVLMGNGKKDQTLIATGGTASLWGGGASADTLRGGNEPVAFWYGAGDGKDRIQKFRAGSGSGQDAIRFFDGVIFSSFVNNGSSVVITLSSSSDVLTLEGLGGTVPQTIRFTMDDTNYGGLQLGKTGATNTFTYADDETNFYFGSTGKDTLKIAADVSANIWLDGGAGKSYSHIDVVDGSASDGELLIAGVGNNETIIGGTGSNTLYGGSGSSNDVLRGNNSAVSDYWYGAGDGNDVVQGSHTGDKVVLYNAVLSDLAGAGVSGSSMVLTAKDGGTLTIQNYTASSVNQFQFRDGSSWTYDYSSGSWSLNR